MLWRALVLGAVCAAAGTGPAAAQQVGVQQYRPTTPALRGFGLESARVLPHLAWGVALDLNLAVGALELKALPTGTTYDALSRQIGADVVAAVGLWNRLELALALPAIVSQDGSPPPGIAAPPGGGLGDVRAAVKAQVLGPGRHGFSLATSLGLSVPTGERAYINERGVVVEPRLIAEHQVRRWTTGLRLGYRARPATSLLGTPLDDELTFAVGMQVRLGRVTRVLAEIDGATPASDAFFKRRRTPVEALFGVRRQFGNVFAAVGAGPGIVSGYGSPTVRVLAQLGWASVAPDSDRDGIPDHKDECVDDPEDRDDFEDGDGCPDPDNDQDGLLDEQDACPNEAEDKDGFDDTDGCPDPDNDRDGILDSADKCPNEPENVNNYQDDDGCPEEVPDTDGDGRKDNEDACPDVPEDKDGFDDTDGCPDPDNDRDGIPDVDDKCPMEPETINGKNDDDGCPDEGEPQVRIGDKELEVLQPIFFDLNRARVRHRFHNLLEQIALTLKAHPEIGRCAVEGHTDASGADEFNQELSVRRAKMVVDFLASKGVDPARLSPIGQGEAKPWAPNDSSENRAKNRRVIFHIEGVALPKMKPELPPGWPTTRPTSSATPGANGSQAGAATPTASDEEAMSKPKNESPTRPSRGMIAPEAPKPNIPSEKAKSPPAPPPPRSEAPAAPKPPREPEDENLEGKSLRDLVKIPLK